MARLNMVNGITLAWLTKFGGGLVASTQNAV